MVALRRTLGGIVASDAALVDPRARQSHLARTIISDPAPLLCDFELSSNPDRACLPLTAAREGDPASPLSSGNDLAAASGATRPGSSRGEAATSRSPYSTGRDTHLKVVVVSLLCATVVAVLGVLARASDMNLARASDMNGARALSRSETTAPVIRAGWPKTVTSYEHNTIR